MDHVALWQLGTTITASQCEGILYINTDSTDINLKWQVLRLAMVRRWKFLKYQVFSERATKCVCALYRQIGDVVKRRTNDGGPHLLNGFHISVNSYFCYSLNFISNARYSFLRVVLILLNDNLTWCCQSCKINFKVWASPMTIYHVLRCHGLLCKWVIILTCLSEWTDIYYHRWLALL